MPLLVLVLVLGGCASEPKAPKPPPAPAPVIVLSSSPALPKSDSPPEEPSFVAPEEASVDRTILDAVPSNTTARLAVDEGAELVVVLPSSSSGPPELTLALIRGGQIVSQRDGWTAVTGLNEEALPVCDRDTWEVRAKQESFGVRVSLICSVGEDYKTVHEIAVLLRKGGLDRIWAGPADMASNDMDSCLSSRSVSFSIKGEKTLERTIVDETHWVDQEFDAALKKRLRKECKVGKTQRVERTPIK